MAQWHADVILGQYPSTWEAVSVLGTATIDRFYLPSWWEVPDCCLFAVLNGPGGEHIVATPPFSFSPLQSPSKIPASWGTSVLVHLQCIPWVCPTHRQSTAPGQNRLLLWEQPRYGGTIFSLSVAVTAGIGAHMIRILLYGLHASPRRYPTQTSQQPCEKGSISLIL